MTKYDKIMQEMTPYVYATALYESDCKCVCCAYQWTKKCGFNKPNICIEGIVEYLNSEADLDEVKDNDAV